MSFQAPQFAAGSFINVRLYDIMSYYLCKTAQDIAILFVGIRVGMNARHIRPKGVKREL